MSKLFSSPGILGVERPPEPAVVKENSAIREDDTGPSQENIVRLPDAIETIENVCDVTADESETVVENVDVLHTIQHVEKLPPELDNQTKEEPSESVPPLYVQLPKWKKPVPLDRGYSMVEFAGRHDTRAAVQRRYQVRKQADPVRHAKHKLYYRNYMKQYQAKLKLKKTKERIAMYIARMQRQPAAQPSAEPPRNDGPDDTASDPPVESIPMALAYALNLSPVKKPPAQASETVEKQSAETAETDFTEVMVPQKKQKKRKRSSYLMILPSQKAKQKRKRKAKPDAADNKVASAAKKSKVTGAAKKAAKTTPEPLSEAEKEKAAKRSMLRLVQSVSSAVECPFDREVEPQRTIDWYKERVGHLEESLEQAIYLNLKDFRPRPLPREKPVKMSTAEFFGEDGQKVSPPNSPRKPGLEYIYESSDTEGIVDISDMPVVAERVRSGSESSTWADYDSASCLSDGNSDVKAGRTDHNDVYAIDEFDREDFRNLGMGYLGDEFLKSKKSKSSRSYANTLAKAASCFGFSSARFVTFPDDKK